MPAGVGYSKQDLTGVRAKLEALSKKKKKKAHGAQSKTSMMDKGSQKITSKK